MTKRKMTKRNLYQLAKKYFPVEIPAISEMEYKRYKGTSWFYFVTEDGNYCKVLYDSAPAYENNLWIYCETLNIDQVIKLQEDDLEVQEESERSESRTTVTVVNENNECIGYYEDSYFDDHRITEFLKDKVLVKKTEKVSKNNKYILITVQSKESGKVAKHEQSSIGGAVNTRSKSEVLTG